MSAAAVAAAGVRELPRPSFRDQARYLRRMFVDPRAVLDDIAERYGTVCALGFGPVRSAIVGEPSVLREMFATSAESFRWGHKFNVLGFVVGPGSMIVSDGEDHHRRRSSVQAAFSIRRLNSWVPMILDRTDAEIDRLEATLGPDGREVDMYPLGRSIVLGVAIHSLFGERLAARAGEIGDLFQGPQDYLELPPYRQAPHPLPFGRRAPGTGASHRRAHVKPLSVRGGESGGVLRGRVLARREMGPPTPTVRTGLRHRGKSQRNVSKHQPRCAPEREGARAVARKRVRSHDRLDPGQQPPVRQPPENALCLQRAVRAARCRSVDVRQHGVLPTPV